MKVGLNRRLAEWERLQSPGGRAELGCFSFEGTRLAERALRSQLRLETVFVSTSFGGKPGAREALLLAELHARADLDLHLLPDPQLAELTAGRTFGQVLGIARTPREAQLDQLKSSGASGFQNGVLVVVDATDPGNVGALLRTALASGAQALLTVGSTDAFHPKAVRTSMGSLFRMPIRHFPSSAELFAVLKQEQFLLCGAVARDGKRLDEFSNPAGQPVALLVGSEAFGLSEEDQAALDQRLSIPMPAGVDSLSINAAASVCLYELLSRAR